MNKISKLLILIVIAMFSFNLQTEIVYGKEVSYEGDPTKVTKPAELKGIIIVNKKNPLPHTYNPGLSTVAVDALTKMKAAAKKDGIVLKEISDFRTYDYQKGLYDKYVVKDGKAAADKYSARPGFSEHQTGLTFDINSLETKFGTTKEGKWLASNSSKYGFIIRYLEGKDSITGYQYEPWHIRYVGKDNAEAMYASGKTLEEYLDIVDKVVVADTGVPTADVPKDGTPKTEGDKGKAFEDDFKNKGEVSVNNIGIDHKGLDKEKDSSYVSNNYITGAGLILFKIAQVLSIFLIGFIILLWLIYWLAFAGISMFQSLLFRLTLGKVDLYEDGAVMKLAVFSLFSMFVAVIIMTGLLPKFFAFVYYLFNLLLEFLSGLKNY
jgi:D-alanyl-D-alanine carboxypeptidase